MDIPRQRAHAARRLFLEGLAIALGGVAALALCPPLSAPASATTQPGPAAPMGSATFNVRGTHGYRLDFRVEGGTVAIVASRHRPPVATISNGGAVIPASTRDVAASTYYAFGQIANPGRIDIPLGRAGRISTSFQPSGGIRVTRLDQGDGTRNCPLPSRIVRRLGTFTGRIEFRGENSYTQVHAARVRGSIGTSLLRDCAGDRPAATIASQARDPAREAFLSAVDNRRGLRFDAAATASGASFEASWASALGPNLIVSRMARATSPAADFFFDDTLGTAILRPPPPFHGSGRFEPRAQPGDPIWSGRLRVSLPGATPILAGARFAATMRSGY